MRRISLVEFGGGTELEELFGSAVPPAEVRRLLEKANGAIRRGLHIKRDVLAVSDGKLRALGAAGVIRLTADTELEIAPKIFGGGERGEWREPLFLLAALSRYGSVMADGHIHAATAYKGSLYDIAGRALAGEYARHMRNPVRQYRREKFYDFAVDGELDFDSVFERNPDGAAQEKVSFDRFNPYNAAIQAAMRTVLPYVRDASARRVLTRAVQELGGQPPVLGKRLRIPSRNREWRGVYHLSLDILAGMGGSLESGDILSPGFMVDTWRIWEWLVTLAMRSGLGDGYRTVAQGPVAWGVKQAGGRRYGVNVFPDVAVYERGNGAAPCFLLDAKYKLLPEAGAVEIDRGDLYEAYAFCRASGARRLFLVYPELADAGRESGGVTPLADYMIEDVRISVVKAAYGAAARQGDLTPFCRRMAGEILTQSGR